MNQGRKLLVTYDGSEASRAVFEPAAALAREINGALVLLQVHGLPTQIWALSDAAQRAEERERFAAEQASQLAAIANDLQQSSGVPVEPVLKPLDQTWSVVDTILAAADEVDAALICMATHGAGSQLHLILGSTTVGVLAKSKRPLMVIRSDA